MNNRIKQRYEKNPIMITIEELTLNVTTSGNNLGEKPFGFGGGGMPDFGGGGGFPGGGM